MCVQIEKISLQNYKLFKSRVIEFGKDLSVFDGPNGYGKTSVFDAVELLITGKISRVSDNEAISGRNSYAGSFLARDYKKNVLIKGQFKNSEGKNLVLGVRVPVNRDKASRMYNPKSQAKEFFIFDNFDVKEEEWDSYKVSEIQMAENRNTFFGAQDLDYFSMYHYVHQENRLEYFKKSETDRTEAIQNLLGVSKYADTKNQLESAKKELNKRLKKLDADIFQLDNEVLNLPDSPQQEIQYFKLIDGKAQWDAEQLPFNGKSTKALLDEYIETLDGIQSLYEMRDEFFIDEDIKKFEQIPEKDRNTAVWATALNYNDSTATGKLAELKTKYEFINQQYNRYVQHNYRDIDYNRLCDYLNIQDKIFFAAILNNIKKTESEQSKLQNAVSAVLQLRKNLKNDANKIEKLTDTCPYCGTHWESADKLSEEFNKTADIILAVAGSKKDVVGESLNNLKILFERQCLPEINNFLNRCSKDINLQRYLKLENTQILPRYINQCEPVLKRVFELSTSVAKENDNTLLLNKISELKKRISPKYEALSIKYGFISLSKKYFEVISLNSLNVDKIADKKLYIENQYYKSFNTFIHKRNKLNEQREKLRKVIEKIVKFYDVYKSSLEEYQETIISQIEIPFYLYSSRLLQSYQSGQGVMIKTDGKGLKFTSPEGEHDVLYTMSSGQLSAVLLSFSLALYKIYAGRNLTTLMIDDPVQCMDDINMVSFIELLRMELKDSQVILSTHEYNFSNFIKYKFKKFNQEVEQINLRG